MKINLITIMLIIFYCSSISNVQAQTDSITPVKRSHISNIIKLNTIGLVFGSISLQDEVYFNSKISGAIG